MATIPLNERRRLLLQGMSVAAATALAVKSARASPTPAPAPGAYLLHDGHVLSMDDAIGELARGDVLVRDGRIVAVGVDLQAPDAERIDVRGRVVLPGLVDTHWHMWNAIARGWDSSQQGPFAKTMAALAKVWTPDASALSVRLACAQAVDAGITTVHNWAHNIKGYEFADAEVAALRDSGVRARFSFGYAQALAPAGLMDLPALEALKQRRFGAGAAPLVHLGVAIRGPDRSLPAIWRREIDAARALGLPVTAHVATDRASAAKGALATMAREHYLGPDVQIVHATHASANDFALLREAGSPLSISPWTELEVGYGLPPLQEMVASNVAIGLSVDNAMLAGQADLFSVMRLAIDLAAGQGEKQGVISDRRALQWATAGGARTLGLGQLTGSLTPGKRADLIAIDASTLTTRPVSDVHFMLTHAVRPTDVELVMIDGLLHKRDRRLLRIDQAGMLAEADRLMATLRSRAKV